MNTKRTAIIPLSEFEELKETQRKYEKLLSDLKTDNKTVVITTKHGYGFEMTQDYFFVNADNAITQLKNDVENNRERLTDLRRKKVPMFNFRAKTVMDLKS